MLDQDVPMNISQSPRYETMSIPSQIPQNTPSYQASFSLSNSSSSLSSTTVDQSSSPSSSLYSPPNPIPQFYSSYTTQDSPTIPEQCDTPTFSQYSSSYSSRDCSPHIPQERMSLPATMPTNSTRVITRKPRFTMGPRADCEKCRLGVPGHYVHFD